VPFWLYDYDVNYQYRAEGRKIRVWRSGDTEYTETSIYDIYRDMDLSFNRIPADASEKMPDNIMDLMEPYDYQELEPFTPEYMSGFMGEKYNMASSMLEDRIKDRVRDDSRTLVQQSVTGYGSVSEREASLRVKNHSAAYGLLPVWKYGYRYKEQDYPFYINGQTAKVVGKVPVSKTKVWAYGATLWAVLSAILIFGYYGFMFL